MASPMRSMSLLRNQSYFLKSFVRQRSSSLPSMKINAVTIPVLEKRNDKKILPKETRIKISFQQVRLHHCSTDPTDGSGSSKKASVGVRNLIHECWQCGHHHTAYVEFCERCDTLQNVSKRKTYFDLMGVEEKFDLNTKELRTNFRELQKQFHPDKYTQKSEVSLKKPLDIITSSKQVISWSE